MAAIYSGIHLKLKSSHTPWPDKLKLARFAWFSPQCIVPNKEQVLLDWITNVLRCFYTKKIDLQQDVVEGLWVYLDDILHSRKLQNMLSQCKMIILRVTVAQIINERILEYKAGPTSASISVVLSCLHAILSSPVLSITYTSKYELLVELLARMSNLICSRLSQQSFRDTQGTKAVEVLLLTLTTYLTIQRQQANMNRVFTQVTSHLLQPLLVLRNLLLVHTSEVDSSMQVWQQMGKDIRGKVDSILQSALFFPDHLQSYKEELLLSSEEPGTKRGPTGKGLLSPVSTLLTKLCAQGYHEPSLLYAMRSAALPLLLKFSLDAFCKSGQNKLVCFKLMTKFVCALDVISELTVRKTFDAENWSLALLALENMLNHCLSVEIYNVAADKINHGEMQFKFYRRIAQFLFNNVQTTIPAWYRCLKSLLALNHMVLEPDLDELLSSVWVDTESAETRVRKTRDMLICTLLSTYSKLRQLPRLFEELLSVICRPAADELRQPLLSEAIGKTLSLCLLDSPPSQSLQIGRMIFLKIQGDVLLDAEQQDTDASLKLFSLSVLLHSVFFSLKSLDNTTPGPIVRQTQTLMVELLGLVKSMLVWLEGAQTSDSLCYQKIQESSFLLTYVWIEVDSLFQNQCIKYTLATTSSGDLGDEGISLLNEVFSKVEHQNVGPLGQFLQKLLAVLRIKKFQLRKDSLEDIQKYARFIADGEKPSPHQCQQLWDLQIVSIDRDSYPAAHWFLVTTNLAVIAPYLPRECLCHVAEQLLQSLIEKHVKSSEKKQALSVSLISEDLLGSAVLTEFSPLFSAVVTGIFPHFMAVLSTCQVESMCPSFLKHRDSFAGRVEDGGASVVSGASSALKRLESVAQEVIASVHAGFTIDLGLMQVERLLDLLQVTSVLNAEAMHSEDYSELFLIIFWIGASFQLCDDVDSSLYMTLLKEIFCFMASFVSGRNALAMLKIVHGSSLLECTMAFLFQSCVKGRFQSADSSAWSSLLYAVQSFIHRTTELIIKRKSRVCINIEKFTIFVMESKAAVAAGKQKKTDLFSVQLLLTSLHTLCSVMTSSFGLNKQLDVTFTRLLQRILSVMGPAVQTSLRNQNGSVLGQSFTVDILAAMVRSELACHQAAEYPKGDIQVFLLHMELYRSCSQQILKEMCSSPRPVDFLLSSLNFLSDYYCALLGAKDLKSEELCLDIFMKVHRLLSASWLSLGELGLLEGSVKKLIDQLVLQSSPEHFHVLLLMLRSSLVSPAVLEDNHREVLSAVIIMKYLASSVLPEMCFKAFWFIAPQIISALVFVVMESSKSATSTSVLTVPALDAVTVLLRQGEGVLSNSQHVTMVLGAAQFVPLEHLSIEDYCRTFKAIHETLFSIIQCHPQVMFEASPAFLNCFYRLVTSIMHEGRQKNESESGSEKDGESLLSCAQLVERMYSHIATAAEDFTLLSSFMLAQYVTELQKVTLQPQIRTRLTEGVYNILDLCVEQDLKFLNAALPAGVREVFTQLYNSYVHYHKTQRQGEDKYTV
ncbi:unhealthy ribosome biogenesis protein 2 homolog isoform X1 [Denticeps clupeoides]|nr:unhealthy ribosome biogenesis protein 2 homolog isoform X1 [Denticeps clupeoides]